MITRYKRSEIRLEALAQYLHFHCAEYMDDRDILSLMLVSKAMWNSLNDDIFWNQRFKQLRVPRGLKLKLASSFLFKAICLKDPSVFCEHHNPSLSVKPIGRFWMRNAVLAPILVSSILFFFYDQADELLKQKMSLYKLLNIFNLFMCAMSSRMFQFVYRHQYSISEHVRVTLLHDVYGIKKLFSGTNYSRSVSDSNSDYFKEIPVVESNDAPSAKEFDQVLLGRNIFIQHCPSGLIVFYAPTTMKRSWEGEVDVDGIDIQYLDPLVLSPISPFATEMVNAGLLSQAILDKRNRGYASLRGRVTQQLGNTFSVIRNHSGENYDHVFYSMGWYFVVQAFLVSAIEMYKIVFPERSSFSLYYILTFVAVLLGALCYADDKLNSYVDRLPRGTYFDLEHEQQGVLTSIASFFRNTVSSTTSFIRAGLPRCSKGD